MMKYQQWIMVGCFSLIFPSLGLSFTDDFEDPGLDGWTSGANPHWLQQTISGNGVACQYLEVMGENNSPLQSIQTFEVPVSGSVELISSPLDQSGNSVGFALNAYFSPDLTTQIGYVAIIRNNNGNIDAYLLQVQFGPGLPLIFETTSPIVLGPAPASIPTSFGINVTASTLELVVNGVIIDTSNSKFVLSALPNPNVGIAAFGVAGNFTPTTCYDNVKINADVVVEPMNTPAGTAVVVQPIAPVTLTFDNVIQAGNTVLTSSGNGPPPPANFSMGCGVPLYGELTTTAVFDGSVTVCIDYSGLPCTPADEASLTINHYENGAWVNVTSPGNPDTVNKIICGVVTSFSPIALFEHNDLDNDGIPDSMDSCISTPPGDMVNASGCSVNDLCPCGHPAGSSSQWKNHGVYVSCITHAAGDFVAAGLITKGDKGVIVSTAAGSNCGH
jgi:hypothetical protein